MTYRLLAYLHILKKPFILGPFHVNCVYSSIYDRDLYRLKLHVNNLFLCKENIHTQIVYE